MKSPICRRWGWVNASGEVQDQTFNTPDAAIKEMQRRLGGSDYDELRLHELGLRLALVEVTVKPVLVMAALTSMPKLWQGKHALTTTRKERACTPFTTR